ncbi:MAG TPA: glycosyltransferase family 39 protein [Acidimicrobiia bacterium]|nr:glycosyltransferase family 39 protein [Acidimicrobiia bacterium]
MTTTVASPETDVDRGALPARSAQSAGLPPLAIRSVAAIAAAKVAFQLVTASMYGLHRDEFYYLAGGDHLAWGYVDHPPAVPALYRLAEVLFGQSQFGLHVLPAFVGGVLVLLGAVLAREFGGRARAQLLTAIVAALGPLYLTTTHFLSTVTLDLVVWALASLLVVRMIRTREPRWWLLVGVVVGLGLLGKDTVVFWVVGTIGGLACTRQRTYLASRWLVAGIAVAAAIAAPNIAWEATHHWATLDFLRNMRAGNAASDMREFLPLQLAMVTLAGTAVWVAALRATARRSAWSQYRWLGVGWAILLVALFASGGKGYYLGSWYLPLVALGATAIEQCWSRHAQRILLAAVVATGVVTAPLFTPVLPPSTFVAAGFNTANKDLGSMLGWRHVVRQVADAVHTLPAAEQRDAVILTSNYSEAGALDYWRSELSIPEVISPHNTYWWWGYGHRRPGGTVVAVGFSARELHRYWRDVEWVATLGADGATIDPQEVGAGVFVCREQALPWRELWPRLRTYD